MSSGPSKPRWSHARPDDTTANDDEVGDAGSVDSADTAETEDPIGRSADSSEPAPLLAAPMLCSSDDEGERHQRVRASDDLSDRAERHVDIQ